MQLNMQLYLYNSLTKEKEIFLPLDENHIRMYVCGPTVYSIPHLGNIRSVIVYDLLFRLLKFLYKKVTYARNITDIDDKIIQAAEAEKKTVQEISDHYNNVFQGYTRLLNCREPTFQPKATENINNIISLIEKLIARGHAYEADKHIYFDISSYNNYGKLSGKKLEDLIPGARVEIVTGKRHPEDFVLWKPARDIYFESPWGRGRPGWHIECSAMSINLLGENFDIHGGGADLKFPHHENEIAQSCAASSSCLYAKYWVHNGFLLASGEKMSKSLGNIINLESLINKGLSPDIIRFALLSTNYSQPLNWKEEIILEAKSSIAKFRKIIDQSRGLSLRAEESLTFTEEELVEPLVKKFLLALYDNLNTPAAIAVLHELSHIINKSPDGQQKLKNALYLKKALNFIGLRLEAPLRANRENNNNIANIAADMANNEADNEANKNNDINDINEGYILQKIMEREELRKQKQFKQADELRDTLKEQGIFLKDEPKGKTSWSRKQD